MNSEKVIPIPAQAVEFVKRTRAKAAIESMQLELMLLKHLIAILDPEYDYIFNQEELTLTKVLRDINEEDSLQSGINQDKPFRGEVPLDRKSKGLHDLPDESSVNESSDGEKYSSEEVQPTGNKEGN